MSDAGYRGKNVITDYAKTNAGKKTISGDDVLLFVNDGIFSCLDNATKAQKKPEGKYGLLKLSDDLPQVNFGQRELPKKAYIYSLWFLV